MMGLSTELNSSTYSFVESTYIDISRQVPQGTLGPHLTPPFYRLSGPVSSYQQQIMTFLLPVPSLILPGDRRHATNHTMLRTPAC